MHHGAGQVLGQLVIEPGDQLVEVGPQLGLLDAALQLTDALGDAPGRSAAPPENKSFSVKQMKRGY